MDYYPCVKGTEIPALLNLNYDYLILDMGSQSEADLSEFLRCDRKLILGSLAPWKTYSYQGIFHKFQNVYDVKKGICFLSQWGSLNNDRTFSRAHHISIQNVPFISTPFRLEKQLFVFFDGLLTER